MLLPKPVRVVRLPVIEMLQMLLPYLNDSQLWSSKTLAIWTVERELSWVGSADFAAVVLTAKVFEVLFKAMKA
jgi:hypothetical protein